MSVISHKISLPRTLIILTALFVFSQLMLAGVAFNVTGMLQVARGFFTAKLLFSRVVFFPLVQVFISQLLIYASYIYIIWYVAISIGDLFLLRASSTYYLGILLWANSVFAILSLHTYYVAHSLFTFMIRHNLLHDAITDNQLKAALFVSVTIGAVAAGLALINLCLCLFKKQHLFRNGLMALFMILVLFILKGYGLFDHPHRNHIATPEKPNIFIISFDALRPDYLSYFNKQRPATPHFDDFLQSSVVFADAFTPLARTQPSWAAILTSKYPLHSTVRENNMRVATAYLSDSMPKRLQQSGYETIYATDDRRFNSIDKRYGFDSLIGPDGTVADYLIGTFNDFPLSNLLVSTQLGKLLFPQNYANHSATYAYDPDNFLELINHSLVRSSTKPLFLAVHFDLSGWPFYWLNDKLAYDAGDISAYSNSVLGDDNLLKKFLDLLREHQLLTHAIVVLISDHGITLGLHGDRVTSEESYQGNRADMKVIRTRYSDAEAIGLGSQAVQINGTKYKFNKKDFGIDTSYNYGGDVLSLKQYHPLLAFKGYGVALGEPHHVSGRSLLIDIAPTLLDLLHLQPLPHEDGMSLSPYLFNSTMNIIYSRPVYLESGFSVSELEQNNIIAAKVAAKSIAYFQLNLTTGLLTLNPAYLNLLIDQKQRAILQGDWLLGYYPASIRYTIAPVNKIVSYLMPSYSVLVNVKTGKWATDISNPLVVHSPIVALREQLFNFYGQEMGSYSVKPSASTKHDE